MKNQTYPAFPQSCRSNLSKAYPMISVLGASDLLQAGFPIRGELVPWDIPCCGFLRRSVGVAAHHRHWCLDALEVQVIQIDRALKEIILMFSQRMVIWLLFLHMFTMCCPYLGRRLDLAIYFLLSVCKACALQFDNNWIPWGRALLLVSLMGFQVGSGKCKAGIAGEEHPSCVFPSIVGRPKTDWTSEGFIGNGFATNKCWLSLCIPTEN